MGFLFLPSDPILSFERDFCPPSEKGGGDKGGGWRVHFLASFSPMLLEWNQFLSTAERSLSHMHHMIKIVRG